MLRNNTFFVKRWRHVVLRCCFVLSLLSWHTVVVAQSCPLTADWTFTTSITESTCLANGSITVKTSSDLTGYTVSYYLTKPDGSLTSTQNSNVFNDLGPGTYKVHINAVCDADNTQTFSTTLSNCVIPGNYLPFQAMQTVDDYSIYSRPTYINPAGTDLQTGRARLRVYRSATSSTPGALNPINVARIVVESANVASWVGRELDFEIQHTSTADGYSAIVRIKTPLPAIQMTVRVYDACDYSTLATVNVGSIKTVAYKFTASRTGSRPDCQVHEVSISTNTSFSDSYYYQWYQQDATEYAGGEYEIAYGPVGATLTNWQSLPFYLYDNFPITLDDALRTRAQYYSEGLHFEVRLKRDPTITSGRVLVKLQKYTYQRMGIAYNGQKCSSVDYYLQGTNSCGPITYSIKNTATGQYVYNNSNYVYVDLATISLQYNTTYQVVITDGEGVGTNYTFKTPSGGVTPIYPAPRKDDYYPTYYKFAYSNANSVDLSSCPLRVVIKRPDGTILETKIINTSPTYSSDPDYYWATANLEYGVTYTYEVYSESDAQLLYTTTFVRNIATPIGVSANVSVMGCMGQSKIAYGSINLPAYAGIPYGSTASLISLVDGQTYATLQLPAQAPLGTESEQFPGFVDFTPGPSGPYKVVIDYVVGTIEFETSLTYSVPVYTARDFSVSTSRDCNVFSVAISGVLQENGVDIPSDTEYSIYSLTYNADGTTSRNRFSDYNYSSGFVWATTQQGNYAVTIHRQGYIGTECEVAVIYFTLEKEQVQIDHVKTLGYVCSETSTDGVIVVQAKAGKAPYTYELMSSDGVAIPGQVVQSSGQARFTNLPARTYLIQVTDQCGDRFIQEVQIKALANLSYAFAETPEVCYGQNIVLNSYHLDEFSVEWTGPDGTVLGTDKELIIPNADPALHNGTYSVKVTPTGCAGVGPFTSSVNISVRPPLVIEVSALPVGICPGANVLLSAKVSGGKPFTSTTASPRPTYISRVESSMDNINWSTYLTSAVWKQATSSYSVLATNVQKYATSYYRFIAIDDCGQELISPVITLRAGSCYAPVNPHLMHRAKP